MGGDAVRGGATVVAEETYDQRSSENTEKKRRKCRGWLKKTGLHQRENV